MFVKMTHKVLTEAKRVLTKGRESAPRSDVVASCDTSHQPHQCFLFKLYILGKIPVFVHSPLNSMLWAPS